MKAISKLPATDKGLAAHIQNLRPGEVRQWLALGAGLVLLVEPNGTKAFQARFRLKGSGQEKRMTLGYFPNTTLVEARQKLAEVKSAVKDGEDPTLAKQRAATGTGALATVGELIDIYLARRAGSVADKTLKNERAQLSILREHLGSRRLRDVEPRDVAAAVDDYLKTLKQKKRPGTSANKVLAATKRMFAYARNWGIVEGGNPAADLARRVKEKPRTRVLRDGALLVDPARPKLNETGTLVAALLDDESEVWGARSTRLALALSLLLGFRASEVASLEWSGVVLDGDNPAVTVTSSKTDAGLRTLPLPPFAKSLLAELRKGAASKARYVFTSGETRPDLERTRAPHLHPESLSRALARAAEKLKLDDLTHHDLRRTAMTGLGELGFDGVLGRIAGHAAKDVTGRHYDHSRRLPAMRAALNAWEGTVLDAAARHRLAVAGDGGEGGTVFALRAAN
jgi:integrase